jgi:hypothetical protein
MSTCIQSSLFGTSIAGRFGNQFFQLLFFYILSEKLNCKIRLPAWSDQSVFENHSFAEPLPLENIYNLESIYSRAEGPDSTISLLNPLLKISPDNLDIIGTFQFDTNKLYKFRHLLKNNYIYTKFSHLIKLKLKHLKKNSELICIHWREGDYNDFNNQHPYFWKPASSNLLFEIKKLINIAGSQSNVYLASDNPTYLVNFLKAEGIQVITSADFTENLNEFFLWDFLALVESTIFIAANSSMSIAAALLNNSGKIFVRASSPTDDFMPFTPWHTEVLINQYT